MKIPKLLTRQWVVYKIENPLGEIYIGKTCDWYNRMSAYRNKWSDTQRLIHDSIEEHGYTNHKIEIIDNFLSDKEYSDGKEIFWIKSFMSNRNKYPELNGLNLTDGLGGLGVFVSQEKREKQRQRMLGKTTSEYQKQRAREVHRGNKYNLGRVVSEETRLKTSLANKGKKRTQEQIDKNQLALAKARNKSIVQLDENGVIIKEFLMQKDACEYFDISESTLLRIINNKGKYRWGKNKSLIIKFKNK